MEIEQLFKATLAIINNQNNVKWRVWMRKKILLNMSTKKMIIDFYNRIYNELDSYPIGTLEYNYISNLIDVLTNIIDTTE